MTKKSQKKKVASNTIARNFLEERLPYTTESVFQTSQEEYEETGYYVQVLRCIPKNESEDKSFILKSTNDRSKIQDEWEIISHLKNNIKNPNRYIAETELLEVGGKIGLKMPILMKFRQLMSTEDFPKKCHKYASQIIDQMSQIHIHDVFHGDIKDDNFMYDPITDTLCLIDFGEARRIENETKDKYKDLDKWDHGRSMKCGDCHFQSAAYRPPECFHDEDKEEYDKWEQEIKILEDKCAKGNKVAKRKLKKLEYYIPDCYDMLNTFSVDELNSAKYTFCYHNTLYSDTYSMGACILEYMEEYLKDDQIAFLKIMRSCELLDRPSSLKLTKENLIVFDE